MWQAEQMAVVRPKERSLVDALALSELLLAHAEARGTTALSVSVVHGPAVILGAMQRTGRVVDLRACERAGAAVLRRATAGTAAWIGEAGILVALALPHVAAIAEDATARTLLNRNVRPFLRAFTRAGAMAHYFGREWISVRKRPAALVGFDVTRKGAVLIEVMMGFEQAIALPVELATSDERAVDRFMGKTPAGLSEIVSDQQCMQFAERLAQAMVPEGANHILEEALVTKGANHFSAITSDMDPLPIGFVPQTLVRVPIGYLETAVAQDDPAQSWLGGDVLAPRWLYADVVAQRRSLSSRSVPIEGATLEDMLRAANALNS